MANIIGAFFVKKCKIKKSLKKSQKTLDYIEMKCYIICTFAGHVLKN